MACLVMHRAGGGIVVVVYDESRGDVDDAQEHHIWEFHTLMCDFRKGGFRRIFCGPRVRFLRGSSLDNGLLSRLVMGCHSTARGQHKKRESRVTVWRVNHAFQCQLRLYISRDRPTCYLCLP